MDPTKESLNYSMSGHHYNQLKEMVVPGEASGAAGHGPDAFGASAGQDYSSYTPYPYPQYQYNYYAYQQQPANVSSHQQVGSSQNTGAYHQPLSSFQNPSSYVAPTGYSGTYYNHGDYQTMSTSTSGYQSSGFVNQTNVWNATNTASYPSYDYPKYNAPGQSLEHNTNPAAEGTLSYQQQSNQWTGYYGHGTPNLHHAPEPENKQVADASNVSATSSICGAYLYGHNQPPPPGTTSWRQDFTSTKLPCLQGKSEVTECNDVETSADDRQQNYQTCSIPSKGPNIQFPLNNQVFQNFQSHSQTVSGVDAPQTSKIQIPTNPRIAPNLAVNVLKNDKETAAVTASMKPAYISVSAPKPGFQASSQDSAGSIPPSLRRYVEKTFARCKNDSQRAANQTIMKEMISNASADGTLLTRDWDAEPMFALPGMDDTFVKKSPNRRTKSRWEPAPEENPEKLLPVNGMPEKNARTHHSDPSKVALTLQSKSTDVTRKDAWNAVKFIPSEQKLLSPMTVQRPSKKARHVDGNTESTDVSSDSDKEQNLTRYYSSAIALANSPEERKKREHRFKRFEKRGEHQPEVKHLQLRDVGATNLYARRTSALMLARNEESNNVAVEDIDWDSLTVKGTCQEVEKCYLRLTSAPDPATVRPEEVLEKALLMIHDSQKNYLYKCDQLKSIRQDLTVQRIRNELTVKVYETHARFALEAGDLAEYNQCQSQLKTLYSEGIRGCHLEFSAYNLLCVILHSNIREVLSSMARLSVEAKKDEAVQHALAVRAAVSSGNYIMFFRLYQQAPNMNIYLMDLYVEKMRFAAVNCMCKSYRPTVPVAYIAHALGFSKAALDGNETDGLVECEYWLKSHGAILTIGSNGEIQLDTKVSSSNLFMPEPEDAVAHGDASLAVNDFLTKVPS